MKICEPSFKIIDFTENALELIERAGRICYQSEPTGNPEAFVKRLIYSGHHTPLEMAHATVEIVCDRGVMAELTRHRLASFNVASTRYQNYSKDKFGNEITVIRPFFWEENTKLYNEWEFAMFSAEVSYMRLLELGATPQEARSVLPNSLKTEIVVSANFREWMHLLKLRCGKAAHPQIKQICLPLLEEFHRLVPVLFDDILQGVN